MDADFDLSGVEEMNERLNQLPGALDSELESAADDIGNQLVGDAGAEAPVDTGTLSNDISKVVESIAASVIRVRIGTNLDYAEPMEEGTDPFFPPPSELRRWAHRVLGDEDLAFIVARSISENGLEAREYLADSFEDNGQFMIDRTVQAVDNAFSEVGLA